VRGLRDRLSPPGARLRDDNGVYKPFHLDIDGGPEDCTHGQKGCTMCTRACPRFRNWESEIDTHKFARERTEDEVSGIGDVLLARATDESLVENGQDGGFVSALLIYALENDVIDAALVSGLEGDGSTWRAVPQVARSREDVIETAKSRYTYSANLLAYPEAAEGGAERIALVGMGCMASAPGAMQSRKAGKLARRLCLTIGLMCSKTFDDSIFEELFEAKYGIKRADILKMNIKASSRSGLRTDISTRFPSKRRTPSLAKAASSVRTSPPNTPTSRRAVSVPSATGRSSSCAPIRVAN